MDHTVFDAALGIHDVGHKPNLRVVTRSMASGKSSSWFFFSSDMRFAVKTCTPTDFSVLIHLIEDYADYVISRKHRTLLPKYLGLFTLKLPTQTIPFVVMNNVFAGYLDIHARFDLKGSTRGRTASAKERAKKHCVLKDLDLLQTKKHIPLGKDVLEVIRKDADWLMKVGVMDYSLLLGVHVKPNSKHDNPLFVPNEIHSEEQVALIEEGVAARKAHPGVIYVESDDLVVYVGIVDILTQYGCKKRMETLFTGHLLCRDVSCQAPKRYGTRFLRFFEHIIDQASSPHVVGLS
eukprot:c2406_g1_i2.p1 GENE.c2406_g1_i2~~c2406_g1_i2.p1  ORF type:complete len:292 (+),score=54.62 c2406_g1_i2:428-1303(+)